MDRYKFLKPEEPIIEEVKVVKKKKKRRVTVTPAGVEEHTPNPIPPRLRGEKLSEDQIVPIQHQRSLSISLLGPPNVGKSTLLNKILQDHIAATSSKAQTTRTPIVGSRTIENTQLVFLDTPGIVSKEKQKKINRSIVVGSWDTLNEADLVLIMADASKNFKREYYPNIYHVLDTLKEEMERRGEILETTLVLNKVDKVMPQSKRESKLNLVTADVVNEFPFLRRVFPISVRSEINMNSLIDYLLASAKPRAWEYPANASCYMSDYQRVMETIREKIYRRLNKEIPYEVEQRNVDWYEMEDGTLRIENNLYVPQESHKKILIGAGGRTLKYICNEAEESLRQTFGRNFKLVLCAHVRSRNNPDLLNISEEEGYLGYRLTPFRTMADIEFFNIHTRY